MLKSFFLRQILACYFLSEILKLVKARGWGQCRICDHVQHVNLSSLLLLQRSFVADLSSFSSPCPGTWLCESAQLYASCKDRTSDLSGWGRCRLLRMYPLLFVEEVRKVQPVKSHCTLAVLVTVCTWGHSSRTGDAVDLPSGQVICVGA